MIKYVVSATGVLIGMVLGLALLLLNPVSLLRDAPDSLPDPVRTLVWDGTRGFAGFPLGPGGFLGRASDGGDDAFEEAGIHHVRAGIVALADDAGIPRALGVRLAAIASRNSLLQAQLGTVTGWNILWPGEGSVLLAGSEDYWPPLRDGMWYAARGRGFQLRESYLLRPLPGTRPPTLISGSGPFAAASGAYRERFFPVAERPGDFSGKRQLEFSFQ
jgi:hypothetical protein